MDQILSRLGDPGRRTFQLDSELQMNRYRQRHLPIAGVPDTGFETWGNTDG